jgi:protein gp37
VADNSSIEWTDATWNPVTGCTKITAGCDNCYAARFAERFRGVAAHPFEGGFDLTLRPERVDQPLKWRRPRMIFVNSMSDLFHKAVPDTFVDQIFDTMERADWHVFQVLTKRSSRLQRYLNRRFATTSPAPHIWCGVSVEDARGAARIEHLRGSECAVRFFSVEELARSKLLDALRRTGEHGAQWKDVWPAILETTVVTRSKLGRFTNDLRKSGIILAPGWPSERHLIPADDQVLRFNHA